MYCGKCGRLLQKNAEICLRCGTPTDEVRPSMVPFAAIQPEERISPEEYRQERIQIPESEMEQVQVQFSACPENPAPQAYQMPAYAPQMPTAAPIQKKKWLIPGIAAAVLIAVGGLLYAGSSVTVPKPFEEPVEHPVPSINFGGSEATVPESAEYTMQAFDNTSVERIYASRNVELEPHLYEGMFCYYAARGENNGDMESLQISTQYCELKQVEYQKYFSSERQSAAVDLLNQFKSYPTAEASLEQIGNIYVATLLFSNFDSGYSNLNSLNLVSMPQGTLDLPITMNNLEKAGWKTLAGQIYPTRTGSFDYYYFLDNHHINETMDDISYSESMVGIRDDSPDTLLRVEVGFYGDTFTDAIISRYFNISDMTIEEVDAYIESMRSSMVEYDENGFHYQVFPFDKYVCASVYIPEFGSPETIEALKMKGAFSAGFTGNTVEEIRAELEKYYTMR